ncbi:MAG: hypothetical protein ABSB69_02440 [Solirubrobacteraceae bacterium]
MAALAISVVAVATASAEAPEFGRCVKKAKAEGSGYSNAGCTTEVGSGAKYEWKSGPGETAEDRQFTSESRFVLTGKDKVCLKWREAVEEGNLPLANKILEEHGYTAKECEETLAMHGGRGEDQEPVTLETVGGKTVECEELSATGEYSGPKTIANLNTTFKGCTALEVFACQSPGAKAGEVTTSALDGELNLIKKESEPISNLAGIALSATSGNIAELECGGFLKVVVTGSVIHEVTTNKMVLEENEKFKQRKGHQIPENFDGGPQQVLESSIGGAPNEQSGETLLTKLKNKEKIEVNTVA